jgi:hypothetical protein
MTPIRKNIAVVDEQGNGYEATYQKRAKGLVKNGRARFIDENTLCLARPPNKNLEDENMINDNSKNGAMPTPPTPPTPPNTLTVGHSALNAAAPPSAPPPIPPMPPLKMNIPEAGVTIEWICSRIDMIMKDNAHITDSLKSLGSMTGTSGGNLSTQAESMGIVVQAREETNRQALRLLEMMYQDVKPSKQSKLAELAAHIDFDDLVQKIDGKDAAQFIYNLMDIPKN